MRLQSTPAPSTVPRSIAERGDIFPEPVVVEGALQSTVVDDG